MRAWQPRGMNANILLDCPYRKFNAADRQAQRLQASNQRSLGSRASRRPSPRILNDKTARKMASPGQTAIQGALVRKRWAVLSMEPHDGAGGCWPEGQACLSDDGGCDRNGRLHDQRRQDVGQDML